MSILFSANYDYLQTVFFKFLFSSQGSQGKAEKMLFLEIIKIAFLGGIMKAKNTLKQENVKWNQMHRSLLKKAKEWMMSTIREDPHGFEATFWICFPSDQHGFGLSDKENELIA